MTRWCWRLAGTPRSVRISRGRCAPSLPMTLPLSSGCTRNSKMTARGTLRSFTSTESGVVHQRAGDVEDQLPHVPLTPQRWPRRAGSGAAVIRSCSSRTPTIFSSLRTRSVGWAPLRSQSRARSGSICTVDLPVSGVLDHRTVVSRPLAGSGRRGARANRRPPRDNGVFFFFPMRVKRIRTGKIPLSP